MASKLPQLQSKASQASEFFIKNGSAYIKQLLEDNKQHIKDRSFDVLAQMSNLNTLENPLTVKVLSHMPGKDAKLV